MVSRVFVSVHRRENGGHKLAFLCSDNGGFTSAKTAMLMARKQFLFKQVKYRM